MMEIIYGVITNAIWAIIQWIVSLKIKYNDIKIPKKTIIIIPNYDTFWHMGSSSDKPAMQIVGRFQVTNITKNDILLTSAIIKKSKTQGLVMVKDYQSNYYGDYNKIPAGHTTNITIDFWISPPFKKEGESFVSDIAILDQFANKHWIKQIEFKYLIKIKCKKINMAPSNNNRLLK